MRDPQSSRSNQNVFRQSFVLDHVGLQDLTGTNGVVVTTSHRVIVDEAETVPDVVLGVNKFQEARSNLSVIDEK
jgi:hypothetical protein